MATVYFWGDANNLTNYYLAPGLKDLVLQKNTLLAVTPMLEVTGNSYRYNRAATMASGSYPSIADGSITSTQVTTTQVTRNLAQPSFIASMTYQDERKFPTLAEAEARLEEDGLAAVTDLITYDMANGPTFATANSIEGLAQMLTSGSIQDINNGGVGITFRQIHKLLNKCVEGVGRKVLVGNKQAENVLVGLFEAKSVTPTYTQLVDGSPNNALTVFGVPFLILEPLNDYNADGAVTVGGTQTSIYALALDADRGYHLVTDANQPGVQFGPIETSATSFAKTKKCFMFIQTALGNSKAIARLTNVPTAG